MIIFLFRTYESGHRLVTIKANKKNNNKNTTSVTVHGSCCWQVTTRTYGEETKKYLWNNRLNWNKRSYDEKTVAVLTIKIKEC